MGLEASMNSKLDSRLNLPAAVVLSHVVLRADRGMESMHVENINIVWLRPSGLGSAHEGRNLRWGTGFEVGVPE